MSEARQFAELLFQLKACSEARAWANGKSIEQAWSECTNPSWMMWLLGRSQVSKKIIVACAIEFAEMCVHNAKDYPEVAKCIEVVKRFKAGQAEEEELSAAGSAAWSAAESARSAAGSAARSAAWSAWSAAESAESAAGSAESAARSAESAARSAESAAWSAWSAAESAESAAGSAESAARSAESAARSAARSAACDAVRKHVPASEIAKLFALSEANQ